MEACKIIFLCALGAVALISTSSAQHQISQDDYNSLKAQIDCVLDRGVCDEVGMFAKQILPELMLTHKCSMCDDAMNAKLQRTLGLMHVYFSNELIEIQNKYSNPRARNSEISQDKLDALKAQIDCVLDRGVCNEMGEFAKQILPEYLRTGVCSLCNDEMNALVKNTMQLMHVYFRNELAEIFKKYSSQPLSRHSYHH
ncbi:uncharacterized protein LOC103573225 [Microplitis demolitor]|uniref:uncharacterized protein LOC103573225 n=1 Tax=Microplitis demolitor TaxID=69319 RepID=UPI0004CD705A|nr:uncharacterized protein LOC103573225 [Microplitis demolitor]